VVGEPALKLSLMPLVVSCTASMSVRTSFFLVGSFCGHSSMVTVPVNDHRGVNNGYAYIKDLPPLPESQSAVAV